MTLSRPVYRWLTLAIFAVLALSLAGCSKSTKPQTGRVPSAIPHADADDLAQLLGATLASDNGGWYYTIEALADSLYQSDPVFGTPIYSVPADTATFSISKQGQTYNFNLAYFHAAGLVGYPVRDTAASDIESALHIESNTINSPPGGHPNYDVTGAPGGTGASLGLSSDWYCNVYQLGSAYDAVQFDFIVDDSTFASVNTTVDTSATSYRYWYLPMEFNSVYVDTLKIRKADLHTNPYPIAGDIHWTLDAYSMKTNSRNINDPTAYNSEALVEAFMTFNGTSVATLLITDDVDQPAWQYRYSVNLKTGAIARLN